MHPTHNFCHAEIGIVRLALPDPTDEQEWQESGWHGASVLQEASHLRQLPPTLDRTRDDTLREMQSSTFEVPEGARAQKLRARCQSGRLRAVPQATPDCH
jgi:hypothetical protein